MSWAGDALPSNSMSWADATASGSGPDAAEKILAKVEVLTVDSAANELLAGQLMRRSDVETERITPNLKLIIRDVTHASRRSPRPAMFLLVRSAARLRAACSIHPKGWTGQLALHAE